MDRTHLLMILGLINSHILINVARAQQLETCLITAAGNFQKFKFPVKKQFPSKFCLKINSELFISQKLLIPPPSALPSTQKK